MPNTRSEELFETYCDRRGIRWRRVAVGEDQTPDYEIFLPRRKIVVEVKEITPNAEERRAEEELRLKGFSVGSMTPGDRVRKKISDASPQIKTRTKRRFPGLLVLFDRGMVARHIDPYQIRVAMYGFETIVLAVPHDLNKRPYAVGAKFGPKRRMTQAHNTSIGAIAALFTPTADGIELAVYHNQYAEIPLDPKLFARYSVPQYRLGEAAPGKIPQWVQIGPLSALTSRSTPTRKNGARGLARR
jgi:hypothetical protein